jgi:molecular chaperone HscB
VASAVFCATCGVVLPPAAIDHFARLDLACGYDIDLALLDRRYFAAQRLLHPDRFATKSATERAHSLAHATDLNRAYETLKDPLRRAVYLLELAGIDAAGETKTGADPTLLAEVMERREALAEAASPAALAAVIGAAEADAERCRTGLSQAFAAADWDRATALTLRYTYIARLLDEARARRGRPAAPPAFAAAPK